MVEPTNSLADLERQAQSLWNAIGDEAPNCNLRTAIEDRGNGLTLCIIIDLPSIGRMGSMTARIAYNYDIIQVKNEKPTYHVPRLDDYLKALYGEIQSAKTRAGNIGIRTFE
jgi:hypothetical protein